MLLINHKIKSLNKSVCLISVLMAILFFPAISQANKEKLILIIHSYHPAFPWVADCTTGIENVLHEKYSLIHFYMDTKRLPASEIDQRANLAWKMYKAFKPDLVMLGDDNALKTLGPRFAITKTPVVFYGININPRKYFNNYLPKNITGVLERTLIARAMAIFSEIIPNAKKALLIMDKTLTSDADIQNTFKEKKIIKTGNTSLEYLQSNDWELWKKTIRTSGENYDLLFLGTYWTIKNAQNKIIPYQEILKWVVKNSPIPTLGYTNWSVDYGQVAAYVTKGITHGQVAAESALEILDGKVPPSSIPPKKDSKGELQLNQKQLIKYKIQVPERWKSRAIFK